jgi:hypothetical protein
MQYPPLRCVFRQALSTADKLVAQTSTESYSSLALWSRILQVAKSHGPLACSATLDLASQDIHTLRQIAFKTASLRRNMKRSEPRLRWMRDLPLPAGAREDIPGYLPDWLYRRGIHHLFPGTGLGMSLDELKIPAPEAASQYMQRPYRPGSLISCVDMISNTIVGEIRYNFSVDPVHRMCSDEQSSVVSSVNSARSHSGKNCYAYIQYPGIYRTNFPM